MDRLGELFDPKAELFIEERLRPHWSQAGAIVFITFRTIDSIPKEVLRRWEREKNDWMRRRGYIGHWKSLLPTLELEEQNAFNKVFLRCREESLDECCGECVLRMPHLSKIVANSLLHFDELRYRMGDFIVMPNHVHLLAAFPDPATMLKQCKSWMHYSAVQIHREVGEKGRFWQPEPFDHLVRNVDQYEYLRKYIADNPVKAKLKPGEYHYRKYAT
jgi:putative transposase